MRLLDIFKSKTPVDIELEDGMIDKNTICLQVDINKVPYGFRMDNRKLMFYWQLCHKGFNEWNNFSVSNDNKVSINISNGVNSGDKIRCIIKCENEVAALALPYELDLEEYQRAYDELHSVEFEMEGPVGIIEGISLLSKIDNMTGEEFENCCILLLRKNGFENVHGTSASGDYGVDILAEKEGISYAIQCKCYSSPVGNKAIQEIYSGKSYYNCMVGAVLTNNSFTNAAIKTAEKNNILLWDRNKLVEFIGDSNI